MNKLRNKSEKETESYGSSELIEKLRISFITEDID